MPDAFRFREVKPYWTTGSRQTTGYTYKCRPCKAVGVHTTACTIDEINVHMQSSHPGLRVTLLHARAHPGSDPSNLVNTRNIHLLLPETRQPYMNPLPAPQLTMEFLEWIVSRCVSLEQTVAELQAELAQYKDALSASHEGPSEKVTQMFAIYSESQ
jgi:hypothetical protein